MREDRKGSILHMFSFRYYFALPELAYGQIRESTTPPHRPAFGAGKIGGPAAEIPKDPLYLKKRSISDE
jgi:hypothetical protein